MVDDSHAYARLLEVERELRTPRTRSERQAFATVVVDAARTAREPEVQLLAADLVRTLARFVAALPPHPAPAHETVAIAWLRAAVALDADAITAAPFGERLLHALVDEPLADPIAPRAYLDALAARSEEVLERFAIAETRRLLHAALVSPADAHAVLGELAGSSSDDVAASAVRELAEPWSLLLPPPSLPAERFARGEALAEAALLQAARRALDAPLRGTISDARLPPQRRRLAAGLYGAIAPRGDRDVIASASDDPLLFGEPLVAFLRAQHRRGIFVAAEDAPALVDVFLANHAIEAGPLAAVGYSVRRELVAIASDAEPDDATWPRRVQLLAAIALGPRGSALGIASILRAVLATTVARPTRRELLRAIAAIRDEEAEEVVLALLDDEPEDALAALRAMGGLPSARAIAARLDTTLAPFWDLALDTAWQLGDTELRKTLPREVEDREAPTFRALRVYSPELQPIFARVCEVVDASELGVVLDLLLRLVSELGPAVDDDGRRLPEGVRTSLAALGKRLHAAGAIRPGFLLDGQGFVSICARVLLERPDLTDDETFAFVSELDPRVDARAHARLVELLRRPEPQIRKVVIARLALGKDAEDLLVSLTRLTEEDDIQTVRQAILALASFGARGDAASAALAECLDHRNMNVKKTAAEALRVAGGPGAAPKLLAWLSRHDNPGFRTAIIAALRAILGSAYEATILAARDALPADDEERARHARLLLLALDGCLDTTAARALILRGNAELLEQLANDELSLRGGDLRSLLVELDAVKADVAKAQAVVPLRAEVVLLRNEAPTIERVRALLRVEPTAIELAALRPRWRDLVLLRDRAILPLLARFARATRPSDSELRVLAERLGLLLEPSNDALELLGFVLPLLEPPARLEVARALRSWPVVDGQRRLALLRACGVLLTRADVDRALAAGERDVLASVFDTGGSGALGEDDREALAAAVKGDRVAPLREAWTASSARTLGALVELYPRASAASRTALLDWMESIQPIGAPRNRLAEPARVETAPRRVPHLDDLDQPRSLPLRARLVAMLAAPHAQERRTAAERLLAWPEPEAQALVAEAWLRGDLDTTLTAAAASAFADRGAPAMRVWCTDEGRRPQLWRVLAHARRVSLAPLLPFLLDEYARKPDHALATVIQRLGDEAILGAIEPRLSGTGWALAELLRMPSPRTRDRVAAIHERARKDERGEIVDRLARMLFHLNEQGTTVDVDRLRERRFGPSGRLDGAARPPREELYATARTNDVEAARRALTLLAEEPEPRLVALLDELVGHREVRIRLHAHRLLRACGAHADYLAASARLLDDELPDVRRTAVRVVGFARFGPAAKKLVALLDDDHPAVRSEAADALGRLGADARAALERGIASARPDKRAPLERMLAKLTKSGGSPVKAG